MNERERYTTKEKNERLHKKRKRKTKKSKVRTAELKRS
jgi:hypothetical protein